MLKKLNGKYYALSNYYIEFNFIIDKPQPKPKAKAKSKAKAWAEVVYIIATRPLPCPALPLPQNSSTASTISPIELKFSGKARPNK